MIVLIASVLYTSFPWDREDAYSRRGIGLASEYQT